MQVYKSALERAKEYSEYRDNFITEVHSLLGRFDVTDLVVCYDGALQEARSGFFVPFYETDDLDSLHPAYGEGIRIQGNHFVLGKICEVSGVAGAESYLDLETYTEK